MNDANCTPDQAKMVMADECTIDDSMFLKIVDAKGKEMICLSIQGKLVFAKGVTPEDAADRFANAVSGFLTARKTRVDVEDFTKKLLDFLGEANVANIEGRLLQWLGIEG